MITMTYEDKSTTDLTTDLITMMAAQLGRMPTEDEVILFIFGTDEERKQVMANGFSS